MQISDFDETLVNVALVGSRAYGNIGKDSDTDYLITCVSQDKQDKELFIFPVTTNGRPSFYTVALALTDFLGIEDKNKENFALMFEAQMVNSSSDNGLVFGKPDVLWVNSEGEEVKFYNSSSDYLEPNLNLISIEYNGEEYHLILVDNDVFDMRVLITRYIADNIVDILCGELPPKFVHGILLKVATMFRYCDYSVDKSVSKAIKYINIRES